MSLFIAKVARPTVNVTPLNGAHVVTCQHCPFRHEADAQADADYQARNHRAHHRAGTTWTRDR